MVLGLRQEANILQGAYYKLDFASTQWFMVCNI